MSAIVTIKSAVPVGHQLGDFARLHGNGGEGDIDWATPINNKIYQLFPDGAGIFGWGHAPWGHHFWGHVFSMLTSGWGHLPWGRCPWGHGTAIITAAVRVETCGLYKFAFLCYDKLGNSLAFTNYADYAATGELTPDAVGDYFNDGEYNGKASCRRADGEWFIWGDYVIVPSADYVVTGTLTPDSAGDYFYDGEYGGKPSRRRTDGEWFIWWYQSYEMWVISHVKGVWGINPSWINETSVIEGEYDPWWGATGVAVVSAGPPDEGYYVWIISSEKGIRGTEFWSNENSAIEGEYAPGGSSIGDATVSACPPNTNPEEIEVTVHTAPPVPDGLKKNNYDKDTNILVLDVAA